MNKWWCFLLLLSGCVKPQQAALKPIGISLWDEMESILHEPKSSANSGEISIAGDGLNALISITGEDLEIAPILNEIFYRTEIPFLYDLCNPTGRITLSFTKIPFEQALEIILTQAGYRCVKQNLNGQYVFVIKDGGPRSSKNPNKQKAYKQFIPNSANVTSLKNNLLVGSGSNTTLWPTGNSSGVTIGTSPENNQVFLTGPADDVQRTLQILHQADSKADSVLIDCMFIAMQEQEALDLYAQIDFSAGPISLLGLGNTTAQPFSPAALPTSGLINALVQGTTDRPWSLDATTTPLKALLQRIEARRIVRAQILVQSGEKAYMQVGRNGYILLSTQSAGQPSVGTQTIDAGTTLNFSPQVLPGGHIRITWDIDIARFLNQTVLVGNVFSVSSKNIVQVRNGEPVVMGGLSSGYTTSLNQGYTGFRKIPVLDLLTNATNTILEDLQVLLIMVPRIANPTLSLPGVSKTVAIPLLDESPGVINTQSIGPQ